MNRALNTEKGFAPILLLIIVLALGLIVLFGPSLWQRLTSVNLISDDFGGSLSSPKPTSLDQTADTSNWKAYSNISSGISFKYPTDWKLKTIDKVPNPDISNYIELQDASGSSRVNEWILKDAKYQPNCAQKPDCELLTIQDRQIEIHWVNYGYYVDATALMSKTQVVKFIYYYSSADGLPEAKKSFKKFLATFKFLDQNQSSNLSPMSSISQMGDITEEGNGKTFTYPVDERFAVNLDPKKHPLKNLVTSDCPIGGVSNLDLNGPDSYPMGFQAMEKGSCIIKNGDFSATIKIIDTPN